MPTDEGLSITLSAVQLSAVLQGEALSEHEILMNRVWGGAKLIGGALEMIGGGALLVTPEPTMITKAGGVALAAHGIDNSASGLRELWTGEPSKTLTQQAGEAVAHKFGANDGQAERAGIILDVAVPVVVAGIVGAARILSIRAGRIVLAEHEAMGGHRR